VAKAKWIEFRLIEVKPKTNVYEVITKEEGFLIGIIKWYPRWRKYAFFPVCQTVFERDCLIDIYSYLDELMARHKHGKLIPV